MGTITMRRFIARRLSSNLIQHADKLMYEAKGERANHIYLACVRIDNGDLVPMTDEEAAPTATASDDPANVRPA